MITVEVSNTGVDADKNNSCEEETIGSGGHSSTRDDSDDSNSPGRSSDESPPRKSRLLTDLYNSCTFALHVADPHVH